MVGFLELLRGLMGGLVAAVEVIPMLVLEELEIRHPQHHLKEVMVGMVLLVALMDLVVAGVALLPMGQPQHLPPAVMEALERRQRFLALL